MTRQPDDELRSLLRKYREPPPFPAETLWAAIEARDPTAQAGRRQITFSRGWTAAAAIAVFLGGALAGSLVTAAGVDPGSTEAGTSEGRSTSPTAGAIEPSGHETKHVVWM